MFDSYARPDPHTAVHVFTPKHEPATVFADRSAFEAGINRLLELAADRAGECVVLCVVLDGANNPALADPDAVSKLNQLVSGILSARAWGGAIAYLGDARFAMLLQETSGREAVAYGREVLKVLDDIRMQWQGEVIRIGSWIGGAMVESHRDGMSMLELAEHASQTAQHKPGFRMHMLHDQEEALSVTYVEDGENPYAPGMRDREMRSAG